ncbi:E3 ubiquitin-protein ligase RNF167-like [Rhagoletis pomonella]|uniref:E3 ubiquitin-protein ligase RNF167-like n=1 Tax=Rhagoletis pomonella TaxID=28610 RepID=UPI001780DEF9|nr:E3 ubiquitin-protein ligase RNF167-like [Rhagoletis pomonella]
MIPVWQMLIAACVGLVVLVLIRPRPIGYDQKPRNSFNTTPEERCPICLDEMTNRGMRYLPCGHAMHEKCYQESQRNVVRNCPVCRCPL